MFGPVVGTPVQGRPSHRWWDPEGLSVHEIWAQQALSGLGPVSTRDTLWVPTRYWLHPARPVGLCGWLGLVWGSSSHPSVKVFPSSQNLSGIPRRSQGSQGSLSTRRRPAPCRLPLETPPRQRRARQRGMPLTGCFKWNFTPHGSWLYSSKPEEGLGQSRVQVLPGHTM